MAVWVSSGKRQWNGQSRLGTNRFTDLDAREEVTDEPRPCYAVCQSSQQTTGRLSFRGLQFNPNNSGNND
jgi:hypothetical protein